MPTRKPPSEPASRAATSSYSAKSSSLSRGTPRGKEGNEGTGGKGGETRGKTRGTNAFRKHPLFKVLLDIGGKDRSLRPSVLGKYDPLLRSAEVQRRIRAATDGSQPDVLAHKALLDAIETLPKGTRHTVGEAALCATDAYENLLLERRIELLEKDTITKDMFRYHRDEAFREIIEYLSRPSMAADEPKQAVAPFKGKRQDLTGDEWLMVRFADVAQSAIHLHYAGLAVLFDQDLSYFLARKNIRPSQVTERASVNLPFTDWVFKRYTDLLYNSGYVGLEEHITSWGRPTGHAVKWLFEQLGDATPVGPRSVPDDRTPTRSGHTPEEHQLLRLAEFAYHKHWLPWYLKNCEKSSRESALVPIVAMSGAIEFTLTRHLGLQASVLHEKARLAAQKSLASYYIRIDDLAPLAGSLSLRQRADAYFDVQGALLTSRGQMWFREYIEAV
jgi:hypothetical protein